LRASRFASVDFGGTGSGRLMTDNN
jgi:hypothetical protein